jgi:hypothetical protein
MTVEAGGRFSVARASPRRHAMPGEPCWQDAGAPVVGGALGALPYADDRFAGVLLW